MIHSITDAFPDEEFLIADGLDEAIIGVEMSTMRLIYSVAKIIGCLIQQGMTDEEALDWYAYNIQNAYVGERTPIYCEDNFLEH